MQSDNYKCILCGNNYEEFDYSKYPEEHICPECRGNPSKKSKPGKFYKILIAIIIILLIILFVYAVSGQNESCSGDTCSLNDTSYTYQENLDDVNCWTRINFCNLGENSTLNPDILNVLKQVNYQQQEDIISNNIKIITQQRSIYLLILTTLLAGLWAIWITILYRRSK